MQTTISCQLFLFEEILEKKLFHTLAHTIQQYKIKYTTNFYINLYKFKNVSLFFAFVLFKILLKIMNIRQYII